MHDGMKKKGEDFEGGIHSFMTAIRLSRPPKNWTGEDVLGKEEEGESWKALDERMSASSRPRYFENSPSDEGKGLYWVLDCGRILHVSSDPERGKPDFWWTGEGGGISVPRSGDWEECVSGWRGETRR